jgi:HEAT repeat-containing protein 5
MADLLRDETSDIDLVGPTLPVLKSLLTPRSTQKATDSEFFHRVVHGLLSSCLLSIDEMRFVHVILRLFSSDPYPTTRGREGLITNNKIKNNFLAAVLILTVIPPSVKVGRGVISRCCFLIAEKLSDTHEVSHSHAVSYLDDFSQNRWH